MEILYNTFMTKSKAQAETKSMGTVPKLGSSIFSKKPSMFSGNRGVAGKPAVKTFIPPPIRVTQNKGGGGK